MDPEPRVRRPLGRVVAQIGDPRADVAGPAQGPEVGAVEDGRDLVGQGPGLGRARRQGHRRFPIPQPPLQQQGQQQGRHGVQEQHRQADVSQDPGPGPIGEGQHQGQHDPMDREPEQVQLQGREPGGGRAQGAPGEPQ